MTTDQNNTPADAGGNTETGGYLADTSPDERPIPEASAQRAEPDADEHGGPEPEKRLSGAQRAKKMRAAFLDQVAERDKRIAELEAALRDYKVSRGGDAGDNADDNAPRRSDPNADLDALLGAPREQNAAHETAAHEAASHDTAAARERGAREARAHEVHDTHMARVEAAKSFIPDWDRVMDRMRDVSIHGAYTADEIKSSEKSELISYYFAQNPDQLQAFDNMTHREQVREIGRLEATLKMPEAKKATTAPPPLKNPRGGTVPQDQTAELNAWLDKTYGKDRR